MEIKFLFGCLVLCIDYHTLQVMVFQKQLIVSAILSGVLGLIVGGRLTLNRGYSRPPTVTHFRHSIPRNGHSIKDFLFIPQFVIDLNV